MIDPIFGANYYLNAKELVRRINISIPETMPEQKLHPPNGSCEATIANDDLILKFTTLIRTE